MKWKGTALITPDKTYLHDFDMVHANYNYKSTQHESKYEKVYIYMWSHIATGQELSLVPTGGLHQTLQNLNNDGNMPVAAQAKYE